MENSQIVIMDGHQINKFVKKLKSAGSFTIEIDRPNHKCIKDEAGEKIFTALKYSGGWDCRIQKNHLSELLDCVGTKKIVERSTFKFWKDNKLSNEFELSAELVSRRFGAWLVDAKHPEGYTREWFENIGSDYAVRLFVGQNESENKHALQSVCDAETYTHIAAIVKDQFWQFVNSLQYVQQISE